MQSDASGQDGGNTQNHQLRAVGERRDSKSSIDKKQVNLERKIIKRNAAARKEVAASVLGKHLDRYKDQMDVKYECES